MDLSEKLSVLIQGAELAQKHGILSLDDAVIVKNSIDNLKKGVNIHDSVMILTKVVTIGQKKGIYTLKDAYYLYVAVDKLEDILPDENDTKEKEGE